MSEHLVWGEITERLPSGNYAMRFPGEPDGVTHEVPACIGQVWTPQTWLPVDRRDPQRLHIVAQGSSARRIPYDRTAVLRWLYDGATVERAYAVAGLGPAGATVAWDATWAGYAPSVQAGFIDSVYAAAGNLIVTQYYGAAPVGQKWRVRSVAIADGSESWIALNRTLQYAACSDATQVGWDAIRSDIVCFVNGVEVWYEHQTAYQYLSFALGADRYYALGVPSAVGANGIRVTCRMLEDNSEVWTRTFSDRLLPKYLRYGGALLLYTDGDGAKHLLYQSVVAQETAKTQHLTRYPADPVDPYTIEQYTQSVSISTQRARVTSLAASSGTTEYDEDVTLGGEDEVLAPEAVTEAPAYTAVHLVYGTGSTFYTFSPAGGYCTEQATTWVAYDWGFSEFVPYPSNIGSTDVDAWMLVGGLVYTVITRTSSTSYQQRIGADGYLTEGAGFNFGRSQHLVALDPATGAVVHSRVLWGESTMGAYPGGAGHYPYGGDDLRGRLYCGAPGALAIARRDGDTCTIRLHASDLGTYSTTTLAARYSDDRMLMVNGGGVTYALVFSAGAGAGESDEFALVRIGASTSTVALAAPAAGGAATTNGSSLLTGDGRLYVIAGSDRTLHRIT